MTLHKTDQDSTSSKKTVNHPERLKKDMLQRLNRIEGQIRGIARMIDTNIYCDDILHQLLSVESALTGVKKMLLESHIKGCILKQIQGGDIEVIDELMHTVGKMIK